MAAASHFSGVGGLCKNQQGEIIGDRFQSDTFDCNARDLYYVHRVRGGKWGTMLTELVRQFPFPEIEGTHFIRERVVWVEIARTDKIRWVNEVLRIYHVGDGQTDADKRF